MKTKVEIGAYEIEIEELEGVISVKATKDGEEEEEVIEQFEITMEEEGGELDGEALEGEEDVKGFDDFAQEEDFEGEEAPEGGEEDFEGGEENFEEEEDETKLESFQSFINKR